MITQKMKHKNIFYPKILYLAAYCLTFTLENLYIPVFPVLLWCAGVGVRCARVIVQGIVRLQGIPDSCNNLHTCRQVEYFCTNLYRSI